VQQCHTCKAVYCSSCSVVNYDEREDRVFCLDCNVDCMQVSRLRVLHTYVCIFAYTMCCFTNGMILTKIVFAA
jgi:hypothetical protein